MCAKVASPGGGCCCSCGITTDAFNYTGSPAVQWNVVSGSWIGSGSAMLPGGPGALLINNASAGNFSYGVSINASGLAGDQVQLVFNYVDANNYHYVQWTIGSPGCVEIHKIVGGVDTRLQVTSSGTGVGGGLVGLNVPASTTLSLTVFFVPATSYGGQYIAVGPINSDPVLDFSGEPQNGLQVGIGTGATASSSLKVWNFSFFLANQNVAGVACNGTPQTICQYFEPTMVGCEWEMTSGSFTASGTAAVPSGAGAEMLLDSVVPWPNYGGACNISLQLQLGSGDVADILFAYQDASNYCYVEVEGTYWFARVYQVVAGTATLMQQFQAPPYNQSGNSCALTIQFGNVSGQGYCTVTATSGNLGGSPPQVTTGGSAPITLPTVNCRAGIRCPSAPSATWQVSSFYWNNCPSTFGRDLKNCTSCWSGSPPSPNYDPPALKVTFSGVTGPYAAALNGVTFELPRLYACVYSSGAWYSAPILIQAGMLDSVYPGTLEVITNSGSYSEWAKAIGNCNWNQTLAPANLVAPYDSNMTGASIDVAAV